MSNVQRLKYGSTLKTGRVTAKLVQNRYRWWVISIGTFISLGHLGLISILQKVQHGSEPWRVSRSCLLISNTSPAEVVMSSKAGNASFVAVEIEESHISKVYIVIWSTTRVMLTRISQVNLPLTSMLLTCLRCT